MKHETGSQDHKGVSRDTWNINRPQTYCLRPSYIHTTTVQNSPLSEPEFTNITNLTFLSDESQCKEVAPPVEPEKSDNTTGFLSI